MRIASTFTSVFGQRLDVPLSLTGDPTLANANFGSSA